MSATAAELTIMRAASNIAREDALSLAVNATTRDEREAVNAGLLARDDADALREAAAERAYWQDVGLEPAERVTAETARWSR